MHDTPEERVVAGRLYVWIHSYVRSHSAGTAKRAVGKKEEEEGRARPRRKNDVRVG